MSLPRLSPAEHRELAERRVGTLVGQRWRLDELLGVGGMASVYAATHRNGSRVALKMLHPELAEYPDLCERFVEEGYAANRVGPPGVVAVLDEGVADDGALYLVMELLRGCTLEEWCAVGLQPSLGEALRIADQVLSVLERAHDAGVVHRDIKPENVFITEDGEVRVLDFGIARMTDSRRTHQTEPGSAMGTPAFMPPEQARGRRDAIDERTDLWALGATLFWTISGRFVHEAPTVNEELLLAMTVRARSLSAVAPHVPSELCRFVDRALEFEPGSRYASAREMRLVLRRVLSGLDQRSLEAHVERPNSRPRTSFTPRRPRARLRSGAIAAALSLLGGVSWAFLAPHQPEPLPAALADPQPATAVVEPVATGRYLGDIDLLAATPVVSPEPSDESLTSAASTPRTTPDRSERMAPARARAPLALPKTPDPLSRRK